MIRTQKMAKIRITGPKQNLRSLVSELHALKIMHLIDYQGEEFETGNSFSEAEEISEKLVKIRAIISQFNLKLESRKIKDLTVCNGKFGKIYSEFTELTSKISSLTERKNSLTSVKEIAEPLSSLNLDLNSFYGYDSIAVFKGTIKKALTTQEIEKITKDFELFSSEFEGKKVIALFVSEKFKEQIQALLSEKGFIELHLEQEINLVSVNSELNSIEKELAGFKTQLGLLKETEGQFLVDFEFNLEKENEKLEAPLRFAVTENAFIIDGWIPEIKAKEVEYRLRHLTKNKIFFEFLKDKKNAPTSLDNPSLVKPFQFFMNLYSMPKYTEIDPTFLVFITFPLFFGFMLGDVGYGLVTLAVFLFLRTKLKGEGKMLINSLIIASLATIFFGFIFGEAFGFEIVEHPILFRSHDLNLMLLISIAVGLIHITLGYLVGFYNVLIQHGLKEAVYEKGSWLMIEAGGLLIISEMILAMTSFGNIVGAVLFLAGVILLFKGEGVQGIIELPSILSNTLSYARLFAVGLASVKLAVIVNDFATAFFAQGGLMIGVSILILLLGHTVNILLGLIGPFLHALRLHYVEFFGKFYKGGGRRFMPFGAEN